LTPGSPNRRNDFAGPFGSNSVFASFPSGHALAAAILAGALLMIGLPECARPGSRYLIWSAAIAWTVLVSGARVCLGTHYPTDILGGVLLGAAWVFTCRAMLLGLASPATAEQGTPVDRHPLPARVPIEEPARPLSETA
jgi:membrane-associated phospholipid phosphatase